MIGKVLFLTVISFMVGVFVLMGQLKFLAQYKQVIFHQYSQWIILYTIALFVNTFGIFFIIIRKFFLKDTGKKLDLVVSGVAQEDELPTDFEEWRNTK